jgi:site-specific DNA-cytosine methylase
VQLSEIVPIDLLIGGSPCNELSLVNPIRKGFDADGSGVLFFDFYRILRDLTELNGTTHLFWMFENVASMRTTYRSVISRFLKVPMFLLSLIY